MEVERKREKRAESFVNKSRFESVLTVSLPNKRTKLITPIYMMYVIILSHRFSVLILKTSVLLNLRLRH